MADDLTGSIDTVVQFRQAGWPAYLLLRGTPPAEANDRQGPVAIAHSLDTRALSPQKAAEATHQAVSEQNQNGGDRLYLKVDSTMRGSVPDQISGALEVCADQEPNVVAVICPAYPKMGRIIRDGHVLVHNVPLHQSSAATDPVTPVTASNMIELVPGAVAISCDGTPEELAERILTSSTTGRVVVDASSDEDLARLAEAVSLLGRRAIPVGSAGLAHHLAQRWLPNQAQPLPTQRLTADGPVVVAITSLNEVSLDQANHLATTFGGTVSRSFLKPEELAADEVTGNSAEHLSSQGQAQVVLLQPAAEAAHSDTPSAAPRSVARGMASTVGTLVASGEISGLVLVGGDGAEATLAHLEADALRVESTATEGAPFSRIVGGSAPGLAVATKAGGFGTSATLTDVVSAMLETKEA